MVVAGKARPRVLYLSHAPRELYGVLRRLGEPAFEVVTLDEDRDLERIEKLASVDAVIVASYRFSRELIDAATQLKFVHHQGVGYQDTICMERLKQTGARLAITPSGTTTGVAEHAVLLALAVLRRLTFADAELREGRWHVNSLRCESRELAGKVVGYVGMGRIGQATAQRFVAFDTTGIYHDPQVRLSAEEEHRLGLQSVYYRELLQAADVLTLHVPLTPATRHLVDAAAISQMKQGAILINTARGGLVDEAALFEALKSGRLAGAGLDVFEEEPPKPSSPLLSLHNTVVTPHISAGTIDAFETKMRAVFANMQRFFAGSAIQNEIELS